MFVWLQIDNSDEQAAQVRRELDGRLNAAEEMARVRCDQSLPRSHAIYSSSQPAVSRFNVLPLPLVGHHEGHPVCKTTVTVPTSYQLCEPPSLQQMHILYIYRPEYRSRKQKLNRRD